MLKSQSYRTTYHADETRLQKIRSANTLSRGPAPSDAPIPDPRAVRHNRKLAPSWGPSPSEWSAATFAPPTPVSSTRLFPRVPRSVGTTETRFSAWWPVRPLNWLLCDGVTRPPHGPRPVFPVSPPRWHAEPHFSSWGQPKDPPGVHHWSSLPNRGVFSSERAQNRVNREHGLTALDFELAVMPSAIHLHIANRARSLG